MWLLEKRVNKKVLKLRLISKSYFGQKATPEREPDAVRGSNQVHRLVEQLSAAMDNDDESSDDPRPPGDQPPPNSPPPPGSPLPSDGPGLNDSGTLSPQGLLNPLIPEALNTLELSAVGQVPGDRTVM